MHVSAAGSGGPAVGRGGRAGGEGITTPHVAADQSPYYAHLLLAAQDETGDSCAGAPSGALLYPGQQKVS